MENGAYLFAAYAIIWAILFGFVFAMMNRQAKLRREIERLENLVKGKSSSRRE